MLTVPAKRFELARCPTFFISAVSAPPPAGGGGGSLMDQLKASVLDEMPFVWT
jgi:hypothetical protein